MELDKYIESALRSVLRNPIVSLLRQIAFTSISQQSNFKKVGQSITIIWFLLCYIVRAEKIMPRKVYLEISGYCYIVNEEAQQRVERYVTIRMVSITEFRWYYSQRDYRWMEPSIRRYSTNTLGVVSFGSIGA